MFPPEPSLLVIFPSMDKIPADHHEVIVNEGTYQLMNQDTGVLYEIPVDVERNQTAVGVQGNVIMINQTITTTNTATRTELPYPYSRVELLAVDRSTRAYVSDKGDMARTGQFSFPEGVEKRNYDLWVMNAGRALEARYLSEETSNETFNGLKEPVAQRLKCWVCL